jgi:hypothetical protein
MARAAMSGMRVAAFGGTYPYYSQAENTLWFFFAGWR